MNGLLTTLSPWFISDLNDDLGLSIVQSYELTNTNLASDGGEYITDIPSGYTIDKIVLNVTEEFIDPDSSIIWTEREVTETSKRWWSICYNDSIFIAVAGTSDTYAYSYDGITWNEGTISNSKRSWYSVCYGNEMFVAVATDYTARSLDGINWVETQISSDTKMWRCVTCGNGKFVTMAQNSKYTAYSTNGLNWTITTMNNISSNYWYTICYGKDKFIATALDTRIIYSYDGISWNYSNTICSQNKYWYASCYANDIYLIAGYIMSNDTIINGNDYAYSTDGITWTERKIGTTARYWRNICYGNGMFVATADDAYFAYSTDGLNWIEKQYGDGNRYEAICYGNNRFVAIAQDTNTFIFADTKDELILKVITDKGIELLPTSHNDVNIKNSYIIQMHQSTDDIKYLIIDHNLRNCVSGNIDMYISLIKN